VICRIADEGLSLRDLETYGRVWGSGAERRALCPFCGDDHDRDSAHASLAVNVETGAWVCHRCERSGLLLEHWTVPPEDRDPRRPPASASPTADQDKVKRAEQVRQWRAANPVSPATRGAEYLWGRGIPLVFAVVAGVRFSPDWYGRPAVLFPVCNAAGRQVAVEGRYIDGRGEPKSRSAGPKSHGVFAAAPDALGADGLIVCEGPITALSVAACGQPAVALCGHVLREWLAWRLVGRTVFVALDWDEQDADERGTDACRLLAAVGARSYRLALPSGAGDWNDRLRGVGLAAMRAELKQVLNDKPR